MAGFHGSAGSNNLYPGLHNLNALPSDYDLALQQQRQHGQQAGYDFQADLDMFTNTQFFDFDMGEVPDAQSPISEETPQWSVRNNGAHGSVDFLNGGDLQQVHNYFPGVEPASGRNSAFRPNAPPAQLFAASTAASPSTPANQAGDKRKAENVPEGSASGTTTPANGESEDPSRVAAEEDKRRRNTAASARFRVKKKQREQALEKSAKEMTDRVNYLEQRVSTLEMENKLLKDLITEKSGQDVNMADLTKKLVVGAAKQAKSAAPGNADAKAADAAEKAKREVKIERADQKQR